MVEECLTFQACGYVGTCTSMVNMGPAFFKPLLAIQVTLHGSWGQECSGGHNIEVAAYNRGPL